jgi:hypothetical protein
VSAPHLRTRTWLGALIALGAPARADVVPAPPPTVTVHVYDEDATAAIGDKVRAGMARVLRKDAQVRYRDLEDLLDPAEPAAAALDDADRKVAAAEKAFDQMDLEKGQGLVDAAIAAYAKYQGRVGARPGKTKPWRDAWIRLSAIRFFDGNQDGARDALRHALVFDPQLDFTPQLFPPQMKKAVIEGRLLFDALGRGKLNVTSEPPGALVIVDGVVRGETPAVVDDVPAGPNEVMVRMRGFAPAVTTVEVNGGGEEQRVEQTLARYDNDPYVPLAQAREDLGADAAPGPLLDAAHAVKVDLVTAVRLAPAAGHLTVTAFLYDARPRRLLRKAVATGSTDQAEELGRKAAVELFTGVRLDGTFVAPPPPKQPSLWSRMRLGERMGEFYRSRAFWPVVGVAAGLVIAAVVVGVTVPAVEHRGLSPAEQLILLGTR